MSKGWYGNVQKHSLASRGVKTRKKPSLNFNIIYSYSKFIENVGNGIDIDNVYRNDKTQEIFKYILVHGSVMMDYPVDEGYDNPNSGDAKLYRVGDYKCEVIKWNNRAIVHKDGSISLSCWKNDEDDDEDDDSWRQEEYEERQQMNRYFRTGE